MKEARWNESCENDQYIREEKRGFRVAAELPKRIA
jgi:hypothetical protein